MSDNTKAENKQRSDEKSESIFARIRRQVAEREQAEAARREQLRQFKIEGNKSTTAT
jgi:hypothetical protein